MKIFSFVAEALRGHAVMPSDEDKAAWMRDPLSHPDIEAMSGRELADLPFNRGLSRRSAAQACCG